MAHLALVKSDIVVQTIGEQGKGRGRGGGGGGDVPPLKVSSDKTF